MNKRKPIELITRHKWLLLIVAVSFLLLLWVPSIYANLSTRSKRYDINHTNIQNVPARPVAIVFGAGIYANGKPTPYLQWRVETAVKLYKAQRVKKLLMTGDNSTHTHDEPTVMARYAESLGVKKEDIILDYAGFNTYDSCYRAQAIFKISGATLVTQGYHLPRAVMACRALGVDSIGVDAVATERDWSVNYTAREWVSTDKIVLQLLLKPKPTVLGPTEAVNN